MKRTGGSVSVYLTVSDFSEFDRAFYKFLQ